MSDWRDTVKESKFVNLKGGQPVTLKFIKGENSTNQWGDCVRFTFETKNGTTQTYDSGSNRFQNIMKEIPDGTIVKIQRFGESTDTTYDIEVVKKAGNIESVVKEAVSKDTDYLKEINARNSMVENVSVAEAKINPDDIEWEE